MKIFLQIQEKRVICLGYTRSTENDVELDVADDHEVIKNPIVFTYDNGILTKDEAYQQQLVQEKEAIRNKPSTEDQLALTQKALDDLILGGMF